MSPSTIKTFGYSVSTVSVLLLSLVSWKSAREHDLLFFALIAGMSSSILGMLLRWISYRIEERRDGKDRNGSTEAERPGSLRVTPR